MVVSAEGCPPGYPLPSAGSERRALRPGDLGRGERRGRRPLGRPTAGLATARFLLSHSQDLFFPTGHKAPKILLAHLRPEGRPLDVGPRDIFGSWARPKGHKRRLAHIHPRGTCGGASPGCGKEMAEKKMGGGRSCYLGLGFEGGGQDNRPPGFAPTPRAPLRHISHRTVHDPGPTQRKRGPGVVRKPSGGRNMAPGD